MNKKITVKEVNLNHAGQRRQPEKIELMGWEEEPFVSKKRRVVRVISIKFTDKSNRIEDIDLRALAYNK